MSIIQLVDEAKRYFSNWKKPAGKEFAGILILLWITGIAIGISIASAFTLYWIVFLFLGAICMITCPCLGLGIVGMSSGIWIGLQYIALNVYIYVGFITSCISILSLTALIGDRTKLNISWVIGILLFHLVVIGSLHHYNLLRIPLNLTLLGLTSSEFNEVNDKKGKIKKGSQSNFEKKSIDSSDQIKSINTNVKWLDKDDFNRFYEINFLFLQNFSNWYWKASSQPFDIRTPKRPTLSLKSADKTKFDAGELLGQSSSFLRNIGFSCEPIPPSYIQPPGNKKYLYWCGLSLEDKTGEIIIDIFTESAKQTKSNDGASVIRYYLFDQEAKSYREFIKNSDHLLHREKDVNWVVFTGEETENFIKAKFIANPYGIACLTPLTKNWLQQDRFESFCILGEKPTPVKPEDTKEKLKQKK